VESWKGEEGRRRRGSIRMVGRWKERKGGAKETKEKKVGIWNERKCGKVGNKDEERQEDRRRGRIGWKQRKEKQGWNMEGEEGWKSRVGRRRGADRRGKVGRNELENGKIAGEEG
jgi:hypothetical protein